MVIVKLGLSTINHLWVEIRRRTRLEKYTIGLKISRTQFKKTVKAEEIERLVSAYKCNRTSVW